MTSRDTHFSLVTRAQIHLPLFEDAEPADEADICGHEILACEDGSALHPVLEQLARCMARRAAAEAFRLALKSQQCLGADRAEIASFSVTASQEKL